MPSAVRLDGIGGVTFDSMILKITGEPVKLQVKV